MNGQGPSLVTPSMASRFPLVGEIPRCKGAAEQGVVDRGVLIGCLGTPKPLSHSGLRNKQDPVDLLWQASSYGGSLCAAPVC